MDKYTRDIAQGNLFKDELFIIPENPSIELSGGYTFPLLFILNHHIPEPINEQDITFIQSILKQIPNTDPTDLAQIGILNLGGKDVSILQIIQKYKPEHLITWGDMTGLKGVEKSILTPLFLGNIGCIHCPEIGAIKENKEQKILLWHSMKAVFNII